ncbi:DUF885 domain-containing protein [Aliikangiella sp. G2MR2-5]|uniref:DUF885 domain-containing protein n=1 Tax=Aliikangiella sp. G2MR2-5 TaxID=2788943 RepID=UPI0018A99876|nr:DUF885 domain-containing protein [Aliikangiella sp. G2MR2-5]
MRKIDQKNFKKSVVATAMAFSIVLAGCADEAKKGNDSEKEKVQAQQSQQPNANQAAEQGINVELGKKTEHNTNQAFEQFKVELLEELWKVYPTYGVYVGYYKYDHILNIPSEERRNQEKKFAQQVLKQLSMFSPAELTPLNAADHALIKNQVESTLWYQQEFKSYEWNPSSYNVAGAFGLILNTDYKPLDERLKTIARRLDKVPAYYEAAKANIKIPTLEHTDLAIQQNTGALGVFDKSIPEKISESGLTEDEKSALHDKLKAASQAISGYVDWLKEKREKIADGSARDFRIGAELYEQKFKYDIFSDYSARELYEKALASKDALHKEMIDITTRLWPKYFKDQAMPEEKLVAVKQLIDHLSAKHVSREKFVDEVRRQMPIIEKFIIEKDLLDMDPTRPLVIRETPEYMRGVAGASVSAPGPYDATANTYYNVTPLDHYNDEQAESYLREYNHWILQILNIHEALPGHYTQLVHANKAPSMIKSIFGNGAMIEGWAVYSERMMLEAGYGNDEPEMWLMYSKWNLRVVVNTILDYSIQVLGMSKEEGLDLLMNQAFQERTEAEGKWRRATLSQVQLTSYFSGYAEIYAFREEMKKRLGDKFDLKKFHNQFLSYGNAPVPVIKKLMLKELESK